ncbi:MAG: acylphosphatase [Armatimonadetes bacterium]|nr:acylphosphatase [Armatimonadota bacterium]
MSGRVTVRVVISGRVQGVGFRYHLRDTAQRAGVDGWCRNQYDGSVEAVLAGSRPSVDVVLDWCRQGPPHAHVEDVLVERDVEPYGDAGFRILR